MWVLLQGSDVGCLQIVIIVTDFTIFAIWNRTHGPLLSEAMFESSLLMLLLLFMSALIVRQVHLFTNFKEEIGRAELDVLLFVPKSIQTLVSYFPL